MVYEPEGMKQEAIRHQMEETRASLADKLESLEQHVLGTVHETTSAVADTAEKVSEAVGGTVDSVKETVANVKESVRETFDLRLQTERHPWAVVGGSVAVGFAVGYMVPKLMEKPRDGERFESAYEAAEPEQLAQRPSFLKEGLFKQGFFADVIGPELNRLKTYALEKLRGVVHDVVARSLPEYDRERHENRPDDRRTAEEPWHSQ